MLRAVHNLPLPMVPTVYSRIVRDIVVVGADEDGTPSVYKHDICIHACTRVQGVCMKRLREEV